MIVITKLVERKIYVREETLEEFADRNGYDIDELNEALDNDELDVDWLMDFDDETVVDYKVERD